MGGSVWESRGQRERVRERPKELRIKRAFPLSKLKERRELHIWKRREPMQLRWHSRLKHDVSACGRQEGWGGGRVGGTLFHR